MNIYWWFASIPQRIRTSISKKLPLVALRDMAWTLFAFGFFTRSTLDAIFRGQFMIATIFIVVAAGYCWIGFLNRKHVEDSYKYQAKEAQRILESMFPQIKNVDHVGERVYEVTIKESKEGDARGEKLTPQDSD